MSHRANQRLREALALARALLALADEGDAEGSDDGCGVLFGVLRDSAYKIRAQAEREREVHRRLGIWDDDGMPGSP